MRPCHARTGFVTPSDDVKCRAKCPPAVRTGTVPHCPHHPGDTLTGGALKNGARRVPADRPVGIITPDAPIGTLSRSTRSLPSRRSWCRSGASLVSYHLHLLGTTPRGCRGTAQSCGTQGCAWLLRGAAPAVGVLWGQTRIRAGRLWMGSRQQSRLLTMYTLQKPCAHPHTPSNWRPNDLAGWRGAGTAPTGTGTTPRVCGCSCYLRGCSEGRD